MPPISVVIFMIAIVARSRSLLALGSPIHGFDWELPISRMAIPFIDIHDVDGLDKLYAAGNTLLQLEGEVLF